MTNQASDNKILLPILIEELAKFGGMDKDKASKLAEVLMPIIETWSSERESVSATKARRGMLEYFDQVPSNDSIDWKGLLKDIRRLVEDEEAAITKKEFPNAN